MVLTPRPLTVTGDRSIATSGAAAVGSSRPRSSVGFIDGFNGRKGHFGMHLGDK